MVMEVPSPQCVGREFVRQYYTLLNQAPNHLHRFYNNNSSFVHGGLDVPNREIKPMVGQKEIHKKIQQLNFQDCHAKISQVDSQATLGDGVVVQVTGELSNGGQPMRRFTQTFVLAAQSPKKYYVHNDIFRYQDMLSDEEADHGIGNSDQDDDSEIDPLPRVIEQPPPQSQQYYQPQPQPNIPMVGTGSTQIIAPTVNGINVDELSTSMPSAPPQPAQQQPPVVAQAPILVPQTTPVVPEEPVAVEEPAEDTTEVSDSAGAGIEAESASEEHEEASIPEEKADSVHHASFEEQPSESVLNEPKTYATLLKSSSSSISGPPVGAPLKTIPTSPPPSQRSEPQHGTTASSGPPPSQPGSQRSGIMSRPSRGGSNNIRGVSRLSSDRQGGRSSYDDNDNDRRRSGPSGPNSQYPDANQLFLGNIPMHATEEDLKKLFTQFGAVLELRILSKNSNQKGGPPTTKVPNYGFITFEDPTGVNNVLGSKPIMFDNQKLNVEEKKPRRSEPNGPRSSGSDMMGRPGSAARGGQPGPPRPGGGSTLRARGGPGGPGGRGEGGPGPRGGNGMNNGPRGGYTGRR